MKRHVSGLLEIPPQVAEATPLTVDAATTHSLAAVVDRDLIETHTTRVDLIFYDVDHSGPSYEARVFINNERASPETERDLEQGYVGSFTVFGHGGCYGDVGHCDIHQGTRDEFDLRPQHPLTPWTKTLIVAPEAIGLFSGEAIRITVVPVEHDGTELELEFHRVRLAAYSD